MEVEIKKNRGLFLNIINLVSVCSSEPSIIFNTTGLHIQGIDKSNVCMYDLHLESDWFDAYKVNEKITFGLSIKKLYTILNTAQQGDSIKMIKDNDSGNLDIFIQKQTVKSPTFFRTVLFEDTGNMLTIPDNFEYDSDIVISSKLLNDTLSKFSKFDGLDLNVICSSDNVELKTFFDDTGFMSTKIDLDEMVSYSVVEDEVIELNYSLKHVYKLCVTDNLSNDVELNLGKECPMRVKYSFDEKSQLEFYITPKIKDN
jgi:proliferating cell nuclear antigen PCNA